MPKYLSEFLFDAVHLATPAAAFSSPGVANLDARIGPDWAAQVTAWSTLALAMGIVFTAAQFFGSEKQIAS
jgi:hypothetical protein